MAAPPIISWFLENFIVVAFLRERGLHGAEYVLGKDKGRCVDHLAFARISAAAAFARARRASIDAVRILAKASSASRTSISWKRPASYPIWARFNASSACRTAWFSRA